MQARFYAPMYGRFLSPDPARDQHFEETQSWNIYSYVQNDPTMRTDPTGMFGPPSDRQLLISQLKKSGATDAQIQEAVEGFNKGQLQALKFSLAVASIPIAWEFGGPLLARMVGGAEAPQAIQKGQQVLQEMQVAAPEAPQLRQEAQAGAQVVRSIGDVANSFNTTKDAIKVATDNKDAFRQLLGQDVGGAQEKLQALKDGTMKVPQALDGQKLGAYYRLAQDYIKSGKDATGVQAVRVEVLKEAYKQVVK